MSGGEAHRVRVVDPVKVYRAAFVLDAPCPELTQRERLLVTMVMTERGLSRRVIAERLGVTPRSAERLRARARQLGLEGVTGDFR